MLRNKYVQVDPKISEPIAGLFCMFALSAGIVAVLLATSLLLNENRGFF
jgi:hypothetical protein